MHQLETLLYAPGYFPTSAGQPSTESADKSIWRRIHPSLVAGKSALLRRSNRHETAPKSEWILWYFQANQTSNESELTAVAASSMFATHTPA